MALPALQRSISQPNQDYRLPYARIVIRKGPMTVLTRDALITEAHVLAAIHGEQKITVEDLPLERWPRDPETGHHKHVVTTFQKEFERLAAKYGANPETGITYVEEAYGRYHQSLLGQFMAEQHVPEPKGPALVPVPEERPAPPAQDNRAKQVPAAEVPDVDVEQVMTQEEKDAEAERRGLGTKRECIEYLTARGVQFSASARLATLRVLAFNAQDIESLGYEVPRGADAEDLDRLLGEIEDAAGGDLEETGAAQSLLEQAAGQSIPD